MFFLNGSHGFSKRIGKEACIEEMIVGFAGALTMARVVGKFLDRDFIRHVETELEIPGTWEIRPVRYFKSGNR